MCIRDSDYSDLLTMIQEKADSFSKGQRLLAKYVIDNYDKAVYLTAAKLGESVGVSESTAVRFAMQLGFKGYPQFQNALRDMVKNNMNSIQRVEVAIDRMPKAKILESVLRSDVEKIKLTLENLDQKAFETAIDIIVHAKHIYVMGIRSCAPLAGFLSFYLNLMFDNVHLIQTNNSSEVFEQMIRCLLYTSRCV